MKNFKDRSSKDQTLLERLTEAALTLSPEQRARRAEEVLASLTPEAPNQAQIDAAWLEVVEQRSRDIDEGRVELIPGEEVLSKLRSKYKR